MKSYWFTAVGAGVILWSAALQLNAVPVTFQVNMSYQIQLGNFDPNTDFVDIAGNFNGWGAFLTQLTDLDADSIYEITIDGFLIGQQLQYKYRINGLWDGSEEFPNGGPNRFYSVIDGANVILVCGITIRSLTIPTPNSWLTLRC